MVRRLLLVDNSRFFFKQQKASVIRSYEISITSSLVNVIDLLKRRQYLAVLISLDIGDEKALSLCSRIRQEFERSELKVVFLCSEDSLNRYEQNDNQGRGPDISLLKTIETLELVQKLDSLIPKPEIDPNNPPGSLMESESEDDWLDSLRKAERETLLESPTKREMYFSYPPMGLSELIDSEALLGPTSTESNINKGDFLPVWFGTNRKPLRESFGRERNNQVALGRVDVWVPRSHQFGECGTPWWKRAMHLKFDDDHLVIKKISTLEKDVFFSELQSAVSIARNGTEPTDALVYIHGFNVSFEEAAIRAAQMGCDLKIPGPTAFFSWPSRGGITSYAADESTIDACEGSIAQFLVEFVSKCGADKVHLVAHSMGNRGLLKALQRIISNAEKYGQVKFGQIFLAAPDVDRDVFLDLAHVYQACSERTTLYASDADKAIHLSALFHKAPRAGYFKPYTVVAGVDTIAVPNIDFDFLGHAYFAEAEALLHDIYDLIYHGLPPSKRQRLREVANESELFWEISP